MSDALASYKPEGGGSGLFLKFKPDEPVKLRVLTTDPLVNVDQWGNTRFSFVVWNHTEGKAQILSKGASIVKQLQDLHLNDDWGGDIKKLDITITATGEGMETRYKVMPLPKSVELTSEQVKEAAAIKLEDVISNGIRLSKVNEGEEVPAEEPVPEPDEVVDLDDGEEVNLDDILF